MLRNRCWVINFHSITAGDADRWCQNWPTVWSGPHSAWTRDTILMHQCAQSPLMRAVPGKFLGTVAQDPVVLIQPVTCSHLPVLMRSFIWGIFYRFLTNDRLISWSLELQPVESQTQPVHLQRINRRFFPDIDWKFPGPSAPLLLRFCSASRTSMVGAPRGFRNIGAVLHSKKTIAF